MLRRCAHCGRVLGPQELTRDPSKRMEAERKALGLHGVLFRYYTCTSCSYADIFVDVLPVAGESATDFHRRKEELEEAARLMHADQVEIIVAARPPVPGLASA
jgi:hypothetical protein